MKQEIRYQKRLRHLCSGGFVEIHHKNPMLRMADKVEYVWHFGEIRYKVTKTWQEIQSGDKNLYPKRRK